MRSLHRVRLSWLSFVLACGDGSASRVADAGPVDAALADGEASVDAAPALAPPFGELPVRSWLAHGPYGTLSSPRAADLNGDGTLDVVVGHGLELSAHDGSAPVEPGDVATLGSVSAHDGATGELLWSFEARQDIVGSAAFLDVDGDGGPDVIIGGRYAELVALHGGTGALLWRFFSGSVREAREQGIHNFYSALVVTDQDADGTADLVVANGGDATLAPGAPRPPGHLWVVSGATGSVIGGIETPDARETYMSPTLFHRGEAQIIFGTGGESWGGSLWRIPLSALLASRAEEARALASREHHGFIAPAALVDLNGDGVDEVIAASFDGTLVIVDGASDQLLLEDRVEGTETQSAPVIARVTDDEVPDILVSLNRGLFPNYTGAHHVLWDGRSLRRLLAVDRGVLAPSGAVAADLDGDGRDEILVGTNLPAGADGELRLALDLLDPRTLALRTIGEDFRRPGIATPWLGDLDGDGELELVIATSNFLSASATWWMERFDLAANVPETPFHGAYMGSGYDGSWDAR